MAHATLAFVGDVMLGRGVNDQLRLRPAESFWGTALPALRSADAVIANLECAVTMHTRPWSKTPKVFHFRADPQAIDVLQAAGIRCVTLANNHTLDFEERGLLDTLQYLDAAGIAHAGAGRNGEEAAASAVIDAAGVTIGVIAFTDNEPPFAATRDRPGTNYLAISTDRSAIARIEVAAAQAREAGAHLVVLSLHWGPNMVQRPPALFRSFASSALDAGVDMIFGHSAHIFQGVQVVGRRLVLYDTGDFLDDYAVDPDLRNDWSFLFLIEVDSVGAHRLRMLPIRLHYARADLATGVEFEAIRERMLRLCAELGTNAVETPEGLEITV